MSKLLLITILYQALHGSVSKHKRNYEACVRFYTRPALRHQSLINNIYVWNDEFIFCHFSFLPQASLAWFWLRKSFSIQSKSDAGYREKSSSTFQMLPKNRFKINFQSKILFCVCWWCITHPAYFLICLLDDNVDSRAERLTLLNW